MIKTVHFYKVFFSERKWRGECGIITQNEDCIEIAIV